MSFHSYRGQASARPQNNSATWSQAKTRHGQSSFDQFGREWTWSADKRSGMPASIIAPNFSAPWTPDQQYLKINPDNPTELYIDHVAMYRDRKSYLRAWHQDVVTWCRQQRPPHPSPKMGDYDDIIIGAHGKPPRALEMIAASAQGNPWVLGRTEIPDHRLVPFLETTSADVEAELEDFDFGEDSYNTQIGRGGRGARGASTASSPTRRPKPKTFRSLAELEAAAALEDGLDEEIAARRQQETDDATSDFRDMGAGDEEDDDGPTIELDDDLEPTPESIPSEDEGLEASGANDADSLERFLTAEEAHDPEARGGRTVNPRRQADERKKDARRPSQTSKPRKRAAARSAGTDAAPEKEKASQGGGRAWDPQHHEGKSMADGAKPFTG